MRSLILDVIIYACEKENGVQLRQAGAPACHPVDHHRSQPGLLLSGFRRPSAGQRPARPLHPHSNDHFYRHPYRYPHPYTNPHPAAWDCHTAGQCHAYADSHVDDQPYFHAARPAHAHHHTHPYPVADVHRHRHTHTAAADPNAYAHGNTGADNIKSMIDLVPLLKQLVSLPGLSGHEGPVRDAIAEAWRPLVDELSTSKLGSLHGLRRGTGSTLPGQQRRILLSAHMDAIGLIATRVAGGLIHFTEIGGIDARILPGQPVTIYGRQELPGVIVQPADRLLPPSQSEKPVAMEHLLVDTGLGPEEVAHLVRPGDLIAFAQPPLELAGETLAGHTLDNRASVAAVTLCLDELRHSTAAWDVWAVASVQEETVWGGARTSPFEIRPDIAISIDVTWASGAGSSDYRSFPLGEGPTLGWGPTVHPALFKAIKELADQLKIPVKMEPMPVHLGTDARWMQVVAEGIPTLEIGIPLRYMHTPVEVVSLKDIRRAGHLMAEFIARLEPDFLDKIHWDEMP